MSEFKWNPIRNQVAILLSQGYTVEYAAKETGIADRTIYRWKNIPEFSEELDRLSLMTDIASRGERLRLAKRMIRKIGDNTNRDLLEWVKYAQSETDGAKLNLAALFDNATSMAGGGQDGVVEEEADSTNE